MHGTFFSFFFQRHFNKYIVSFVLSIINTPLIPSFTETCRCMATLSVAALSSCVFYYLSMYCYSVCAAHGGWGKWSTPALGVVWWPFHCNPTDKLLAIIVSCTTTTCELSMAIITVCVFNGCATMFHLMLQNIFHMCYGRRWYFKPNCLCMGFDSVLTYCF